MNTQRACRLFLGALTAVALFIFSAWEPKLEANPIDYGARDGEGPVITAAWPDSTTIHVYLPEHPTDSNADDGVRTGFERWEGLLSQQGITIEFHMGVEPPENATNTVIFTWEADGEFGRDEGRGTAAATPTVGGATITRGTVQIEQDQTSGETLENLAMHEFGHALGFDDDRTPPGGDHNAMDPTTEATGAMGFSARDSMEWASLYGTAEGDHAEGEVTGEEEGNRKPNQTLHTYTYTVSWISGPEIPIFDLYIGADPAEVSVVSLPPDWELDWPPVYLDGMAIPPATAATRKLHFKSTIWGFSAAHASGTFVLSSPWPPGPGFGHIMVDNDQDGWFDLIPLVVPTEPTTAVPPPDGGGLEFHLFPASPNPFINVTALTMSVPSGVNSGTVEFFDLAGRRIRHIELSSLEPGIRTVLWNGRTDTGRALSQGVYFYRVTLAGRTLSGRLVKVQ